ncbi:hypothetical protein Btru_016195 [Bulinus truncatus]|nr:hypothetical protein Btru_016195 [Bulinus truncatus]
MATAAVTLAATSMSHLHLLTKQEEIFKTIHSNNFKFKGDGEKHKENWEKGEKIGTGRFSIVYKAKVFIHTNALDMAVKQIKTNEESNQKAADTELDALSKLSHERIVKYYGCCAVEFNLNIFMEYMPLGSLKCYIRKKGALDEDLVHFFTRQLLEGILYLHKQRVIHRDIKSDNILMSDDRGVKLADFGLCKLFGEFSKASTTGVGTSNYMAPERFRDDKYSYPVDIWSLGCVVLEMLTGESPFSTMEQTRIIGILMGEKPSPVEYVKQKLPPSSEQFLCKIFQSDPGARPTASDLFQNDSYLTGSENLNENFSKFTIGKDKNKQTAAAVDGVEKETYLAVYHVVYIPIACPKCDDKKANSLHRDKQKAICQ